MTYDHFYKYICLIIRLFNKINKNNDTSVSVAELRVLLLGVKMDDDDKNTEREVEMLMASFDTSGDGLINQDEFTTGMTKLASDLTNQTSTPITTNGTSNSQVNRTKRKTNVYKCNSLII